MNDLRDLSALLRSRVPIIVIETMEEQRALKLLADLAEARQTLLYRWSAATGLVHTNFRYGPAADPVRRPFGFDVVEGAGTAPTARPAEAGRTRAIEDTRSIQSALAFIDGRGQPGIYVLLDLHPYLEDPVALRLLREIALDHAVDGRTLVLVSPSLRLPPKLARHAARLSLPLPDEARIRELLETEFALFARQAGRAPVRNRGLEDAMVRYASGLCEEDVRHLLRLAVRDDGCSPARTCSVPPPSSSRRCPA
ncbi:hypothetical protein [Pseudothauera rhizosphaerae]|uniref:hypothetical protein n=1 Tax=Pseudothauera rhizosphaerae TaxID=2565932 RepID=UPI001B3B2B83|nr:hypothetical protein [Pseudothauera rhizosphaerae]